MTTLPPSPELASQRAGRGRHCSIRPLPCAPDGARNTLLQGTIALPQSTRPDRKGQASSWSSGAGNETRTRDPDLGKVVLYQLSYSRFGERTSLCASPRLSSTDRPQKRIRAALPTRHLTPHSDRKIGQAIRR